MLSLVRIHTCSPWKWISVVGYWTFLFTVRLSERIVSVLWSFDCKTDWFFSVAAYLWFPWCCWWSACTSSSPSGEAPAVPRSSSPVLTTVLYNSTFRGVTCGVLVSLSSREYTHQVQVKDRQGLSTCIVHHLWVRFLQGESQLAQ